MLSLGMDSALALATARRRRAFIAGSGRPALAATVISRESLENSLDRALSARPLRCMMFLNFEWPAIECLLACEKILAWVLAWVRAARTPRHWRGLGRKDGAGGG